MKEGQRDREPWKTKLSILPSKNSGSAYKLHSGFVSICGANSFSRLIIYFYSSKNSSLNSRHISITCILVCRCMGVTPPPPGKFILLSYWIYIVKLLKIGLEPLPRKQSYPSNPTPPHPYPPPQFLDMKYRYNNSIMYFFFCINAFPIPIIKVLSSQPIKICMASINLLNNGDQTNVELKVQCFNQTHSLIILTHFLFF